MLVVSIFVLFTLFVQAIAEKCTTPNNEEAECIPLFSCSTLLTGLLAHKNETTELIKKSYCGAPADDRMVCCGSESVLISPKNNSQSEAATTRKHVLSNRSYCGYQHSDDYFQIENGTKLNEFPWLALLLLRDINVVNGTLKRCSGSLISNRYVLTTAHCIANKRFNVSVIRLGEHNVEKAEDCIEEDKFFEECSDPVEDYGAEKIIPHPQYVRSTNDIALIRLDRTVTYSDYIRPICLPLPGSHFAQIGDILTTSGWGTTSTGVLAKTKKKTYSKLITNEECSQIYEKVGQHITGGQLCTIELDNNTDISCTGDSGGPVMYSFRSQWHQEGIISFGSRSCHIGFADVHTRVASYLDWIEENVLP